MNEVLQGFFKEVIESSPRNSLSESEVIYKGFKITLTPTPKIQNVRLNDFYTDVSKSDLHTLTTRGFIIGADQLAYKRYNRRIKHYLKVLGDLYTRRYHLEDEEITDKRLIKNCRERISYYEDLFYLNQAKALQHEEKYGIVREDF